MADEYRFLRIEKHDSIAVLVIQRPDKLNALNAETIDEIRAAFAGLGADDAVRGVIVTGAGEKAFVAGADIGELAGMDPLQGVAKSRQGQDTFRMIERLGKPVIAAINGYAIGGGLELALACHIRIASENARLGLSEVKLGVIPGYGGTVRLPRLIGRGAALELILTGDLIDAREALRLGLVSRTVPQVELLPVAEQLLLRILANGPVAIRHALEAVDRGLDSTMEEALVLEGNLFGLLAATEDMHEGLRAFLEKRPPEFRGR
jgi:enoyl-CoA hydratase